ncbi:TetR/AcrR family transcriptional regulator [Nonomuraea antimicrobica]
MGAPFLSSHTPYGGRYHTAYGSERAQGCPLTLEEIGSTALRLVDEGGIEGLSMRKLAAELDVNPMSLYHHVESKEALLGLICHGAAEGMALPPDDGSPGSTSSGSWRWPTIGT